MACRVRATVLWDFRMVSGLRGSGTLGPRSSTWTPQRLALELRPDIQNMTPHHGLAGLQAAISRHTQAASCPVYVLQGMGRRAHKVYTASALSARIPSKHALCQGTQQHAKGSWV